MKKKNEQNENPARQRGKFSARDVAFIALSVALITVCAWISIPVATIPVTLQTLAVALVGALLGWKRGIAAVFIYIFMGLIGIPVYSSFRAGPATLFGITGGYIFGFLFLALLPALCKLLPLKRRRARFLTLYLSMILGLCACYLFGTVWFVFMYRCTVLYALTVCVLPYLLPDAVKLLISALLAVKLERHFN